MLWKPSTRLIFLMATGIVVRTIAPYVNDKRTDPAVVVVDELGKYAISLLSGHIGGANALTKLISEIVGAQPVITTATDVNNLPAVDILALEMGLTIEPFSSLKAANAAIVDGNRVVFVLDSFLSQASKYKQVLQGEGLTVLAVNELTNTTYDYAIVISDKLMEFNKPHIYLRPQTLAVGIGCRRGISYVDITDSIRQACRKIGRSASSIAVIGSTELKATEKGLCQAARYLNKKQVFFTNAKLQECIEKNNLKISAFVKTQIGVGNICEAAALLAGQSDKLILKKTVFPKITVAIAEVKLP